MWLAAATLTTAAAETLVSFYCFLIPFCWRSADTDEVITVWVPFSECTWLDYCYLNGLMRLICGRNSFVSLLLITIIARFVAFGTRMAF